MGDILTPDMFGAGSGGDDTAAFNAWWAAIQNGGRLAGALSGRKYNITSTLNWTTSDKCAVLMNGSTITKKFDGDLIVINGRVSLLNKGLLTSQNGKTGRGIYVQSEHEQEFRGISVTNMAGPCLEYVPGAGIRSIVDGGQWYRATSTDPAIVWPDDIAGGFMSTHRELVNVHSGGGALIDFGAVDNGSMINCVLAGMACGESFKLRLIGNRFSAAASGALLGSQHILQGNVFADDLVLGTNCRNSVIGPNLFATNKGVVDNSGTASNLIWVTP